MKRPKKYFFVIFVVFVFLGTNIFIFHDHILLSIGDFLIIRDELQPADVIHVIAGLDHRTDYAIHLYKLGYGKRIFFTGGWCPIENHYHGEYGKKRALEQGIPSEAIVADDSQVTSTYSEIVRLKKFIEKSSKPIHSILAVSDPHHMRRARWAYRQVLGKDITLTMAPVPFDLSPYQEHWWTDGKSKGMVEEEYLKLAYYIARYQLSWGFLKDWLESFDRD
jgi:uncharacterized SAM-binding protein YcdF (DUF218 family)